MFVAGRTLPGGALRGGAGMMGTQSADPLAILNGLRLKLHPPQRFAYSVTSGGFAGGGVA